MWPTASVSCFMRLVTSQSHFHQNISTCYICTLRQQAKTTNQMNLLLPSLSFKRSPPTHTGCTQLLLPKSPLLLSLINPRFTHSGLPFIWQKLLTPLWSFSPLGSWASPGFLPDPSCTLSVVCCYLLGPFALQALSPGLWSSSPCFCSMGLPKSFTCDSSSVCS